MSSAVSFDPIRKRDIGQGVPATCDHPGCGEWIVRSTGHLCAGSHCGLYFCDDHFSYDYPGNDYSETLQTCERCSNGEPPFSPTPDLPKWLRHKLSDDTWQSWRDENPDQVAAARAVLADA